MMNRPKVQDKIRESEVEEALASNLSIITSLLGLKSEPKLLTRQLHLNAESRIDLLLLSGRQLVLVELKVTRYYAEHKEQILRYRREIENLQNQGELPPGQVNCYLMVTSCLPAHLSECQREGVTLIRYSPETVLSSHYQNLLKSTPFLRVKPNDYGVFSLGLIDRTLIQVQSGETTESSISKNIGLSLNTVRNHLKTATELGLVRKRDHKYFLTDLGDNYTSLGNKGKLQDQISERQAELLRQYIAKAPFSSSIVFGIYAVVETTFLLARNTYPVEFKTLAEHFTTISGKVFEWKQAKSKSTATYTFLNFAIDLGLLGKLGTNVVITPSGFRFILMLQLYKSIEMIDSLQS
jgi:DNA-binding transcriptional ArsR family regulator